MKGQRYFALIITLFLGLLIAGTILSCDDGNGEKDDEDDGDDDLNDDDVDDDSIEWYSYTIDSEAGDVLHTSIFADSNDGLHIGYVNRSLESSSSYIKYAKQTDSEWEISEVRDFNRWLESAHTSFDVDPMGNMHISYCADLYLEYATNAYGAWQSFEIDYCGYNPSITLDSLDSVHIAFEDSEQKIKYATNSSGEWTVQTIATIPECNRPSIAIDSSGKVHTSCVESMTYEEWSSLIYYSTNASGEWETIIIDVSKERMRFLNMAIDSNDKLHLIYFDPRGDRVKYATNSSGEWWIFDIEHAIYAGHVSLAVDHNDKVHISYSNEDDGALKYATSKSSIWRTFTIDTRGDTGYYTSIAVDSEDFVHISYFNNTNDDLIYVTNRKPD